MGGWLYVIACWHLSYSFVVYSCACFSIQVSVLLHFSFESCMVQFCASVLAIKLTSY